MESKSTLIMCGDIEVMSFNLTTGKYNIYHEELVPFALKNNFKIVKPYWEIKSDYDDAQRNIAMQHNSRSVMYWLSNRTLLLSRKNAKKLYNAFRLEQQQDEISRAKLSLMCRACSILDNYWIKVEGDSRSWEETNLRHISLNEIVAQVALHGTSLSLQGSIDNTPEFLTNGASAKCWRRYPDGKLWMHKAGDNGNTEARIEVMVSNILDRCNVEHCHYEETYDDDLYVSACPAMTDDNISIVPGDIFCAYCNRLGLNVELELKRIDSDGYYKMLVVDYLIANPDRHTQNWGLYYNPNTMELLRMHPLFDHNNAFDIKVMDNENFDSHFGTATLKQNALMAIKRCDFHFTQDITRDLFITQRQYDCFMKRAEQLGLLNNKKKSKLSDLLESAEG